MPAIYTGLNDDEVFQNDLSIGRVEALEGGTSGVLTPNGAGATINFISRPLNYDQAGGLFRVTAASYGDERADLWYSAPVAKDMAFSISGYDDTTRGTRSSPFTFNTYHLKAQLEKKFQSGGYIRFTAKTWDEHDPYYADQPYAYNNGKITSIPGLNTQDGSIIGPGFAHIVIPDSCAAGECTRTFSELNGIHATGNQFRVDLEKPVNDSLTVFAKVRHTYTDWDFNGIFAGSGTGNSGLTSAVNYLANNANTPSQVAALEAAGLAAYPGTTQFGIKNLTNGQIIAASNTAALNALNGNGLLELTELNRQEIKLKDWGADFGVRYESTGTNWTNSLTAGAMLYSTDQTNDQSAVSTVVNDVTNQSNIYDIVAMNASGNVLGDLSNNGLISYGDWGNGISYWHEKSASLYFNDEFTWNNKLHVDFGMRAERETIEGGNGNSSPAAVPAGTAGVIRTNPNAFNGTYSTYKGHETPLNWTLGVNYVFSPAFSVYGRYEQGYQTNGSNPKATGIKLSEVGATYAGHGLVGTLRVFHTAFNNQSWGGGVVPSNPDLNQGFFADSSTNGLDFDATYRPPVEALRPLSIRVQGTLQKSEFSNVRTGVITINGQNIASQVDDFYNGLTPQRTPDTMYMIQPQWDLPDQKGTLYVRYKYIGRIYADNGDQVELPAYGVWSLGAIYNVTSKVTANLSVDNVSNELGLTEGNPRAGFTQTIVNGYFYGRGIPGTTAQASLTFKF